MARKFSLKDNPIFQRLEVPKPREVVGEVDVNGEDEVPPSQQPSGTDNISTAEGQILTLKNRASKIGPHASQSQQLASTEKVASPTPITSQRVFVSKTPLRDQEKTVRTRENEDSDERFSTPPTILPPDNTLERDQPHEEEGKNYRDNRGSEFEGQILTLKRNAGTLPSGEISIDEVPYTEGDQEPPDIQDKDQNPGPRRTLNLEDQIEKSHFFSFYNEVTDGLLPTLNPAEQILYSRLFRLSYGFNRNYCTVSQQLLRERTGLSRNTIRTGLQSLVLQEWLQVVDAGNHVSTTYRVVLPREKNGGSKFDPQNQTLKIGLSKIEPQKLSVKFRGSNIDRGEGQKMGVQNLTRNDKIEKLSNESDILNIPGSNFDPQQLTPLLITNNSLTLSERESRLKESKDKFIVSAEQIVDEFYTLLSQKPASTKRQKSIDECIALLRDGFSHDQLHYAVRWTLAKLPETGSFSRVVHFIDQALKAYAEGEKIAEKQRARGFAHDQRRQQEREQEEEEKRIDEIRRALSADEMEKLLIEATRLVAEEHGNVRFGRETLIQIKIRELIRRNHIAT